MKNDKLNVLANLQAFHEDEDGVEAVQVVLILAIAAVVLVVLWKQWPNIKAFYEKAVGKAVTDPQSDL